jgi:hypothetical protein
MSAPPRRAVLTGTAAATLGAVAATGAAAAEQNPDAELIRVCAQHAINKAAVNAGLDYDEGPLWDAYDATRDFISDSAPQTLAGVLAKVRAAKDESMNSDGTERWEGSMGEAWAGDIINDLLRVAGASEGAA